MASATARPFSGFETTSLSGDTLLAPFVGMVTGLLLRKLVVGMHLAMLPKMVAAREAFMADLAYKPLFARVDAYMALELVGARESPRARQEGTHEWTLVVVCTDVCIQLTRLSIFLATLRTNVDFGTISRPHHQPKSLRGAIGTAAFSTSPSGFLLG